MSVLYNFQRKWPIIEQSNNEIKPKWSTITHAEYSLLLKMILFQLEIELSYQKCIHLLMNAMFLTQNDFHRLPTFYIPRKHKTSAKNVIFSYVKYTMSL